MTFLQLQNQVLKRIKKEAETGEWRDYVKEWINSGMHIVAGEELWKELFVESTITLADGTATYVLPLDFGYPAKFYHKEYSTYCEVPLISTSDFYAYEPSSTIEGIPELIRVIRTNGVIAQPAAASTLSVVSSSTSDNTQIVTIEGIVSGYEDYEEVTLNGTTAATTTKSFTSVRMVNKNAYTTGRITITAGAVTVAVIPVGTVYTSEQNIIRPFPIPDATRTLYYEYYRELRDLYNDSDRCLLGSKFDELIILQAEIIGHQLKLDLQTETSAFAKYSYLLRELKHNNNANRGNKLTFKQRGEPAGKENGFLNLGAYYPEVRWK